MYPTLEPTRPPTALPTTYPSYPPSASPSALPTPTPKTPKPTMGPTLKPTHGPTPKPTNYPTHAPVIPPTPWPTPPPVSAQPTFTLTKMSKKEAALSGESAKGSEAIEASPSASPTEEAVVLCTSTNHGATDVDGDGCLAYRGNEHWCGEFDQPSRGFEANVMCCACGGGWHGLEGSMPTSIPTLKPTARPSTSPTTQPTAQPTLTPSSSRPTPQPTRRPAKPKPTTRPTPKPTRPSEHLVPGGTCKVTNKCFHYACDDWIDYDPSKYTCETLEKQGCDCSACSCHHPNWGEPTASPVTPPTSSPTLPPTKWVDENALNDDDHVAGGTCDKPKGCFEFGCDDWVDYDPATYTCEALEGEGCDCGGCVNVGHHWPRASFFILTTLTQPYFR